MLFTQLTFVVFLVLVLVGNWLTCRWSLANRLFLLGASLCFFAYWSAFDFCVFVGVTAANAACMAGVQRAKSDGVRRACVWLSVLTGLGTIGCFKYRQFLWNNLAQLAGCCGWQWEPSAGGLVIPLAISFYTFQQMSIVIDVYRGQYRISSLLNYLLYVAFFPHLLAGPIVRGGELLPQIELPPRQRAYNWSEGLFNFFGGWFLKVAVGDHLSDIIDPFWNDAALATLSTADAWCLALMYSAQIFADFAGYSFMAIGVAHLLGFTLPDNFRAPYLACSFSSFWRRWHITLSTFLRDYLYIGLLGGNRVSRGRVYVNLLLTMIIGGLWHGAAWTFVLWGAVHGLGLAVERGLRINDRAKTNLGLRAAWYLFVQFSVLLAWVLFRSPSMAFAAEFISRLLLLEGHALNSTLAPVLSYGLVLIVPVIVYHAWHVYPKLEAFGQWLPMRGALTGALVYGVLAMPHLPQGFIYFVF
ncbi:MAG TPA: MBOAT family O-acyltransferase [Pirellulales bacterium]